MTDVEERDALFRIDEVIEWVRVYIHRGDAHNAGYWAFTLAHIGNRLLARREANNARGSFEVPTGQKYRKGRNA